MCQHFNNANGYLLSALLITLAVTFFIENSKNRHYVIRKSKKLLFRKLSVFDDCIVQMRAPKTAAYCISPIEIGLIWAKISYIKSHSKAFGFDTQTDMK